MKDWHLIRDGKYEYLTWSGLEYSINKIADWADKQDIENIYGIPRGGLIPAVMLSHKLEKTLIKKPNKKTLICDDICETGKTLENYEGYLIATIYYKAGGKPQPNYWVFEKTKRYIVFPWERPENRAKDRKAYQNRINLKNDENIPL